MDVHRDHMDGSRAVLDGEVCRMKPQPKVQRRSMAHRLTHEPPDSAWHDVAAVIVAMIALGIVAIAASIVPLQP